MTYGSVYEITNPLTTVGKQRFIDYFGGKVIDSEHWDITNEVAGNSAMDNSIDGGFKLQSGTTNSSYVQMDFDTKRPFNRAGCSIVWAFKGGIPANSGAGWIQLGIGLDNGNNGAMFFVQGTTHKFQLRTARTESFSMVDSGMVNDREWHTTKVHSASDGGATGGAATLWIDGILRATCSTNLQSSAAMQPQVYLTYGNDPYINKTLNINYCEAWNT